MNKSRYFIPRAPLDYSVFNLSPFYAAQLLIIISISVYYPSIIEIFYTGHVINIDDHLLIQSFIDTPLTIDKVLDPGWSTKYYRPVVDFTFWVDQSIWGVSSFSFRLTNLLIHTTNVILVYFLSSKFLYRFPEKNKTSFIAALLFTVHPINVESVSWIVGRTDPLATLWSLIAIFLYLTWKKNNKNSIALFMSTVCMLLAFLSKEVALVTPFIVISYEYYFSDCFGERKGKLSSYIILLILFIFLSYLPIRFYGIPNNDFFLKSKISLITILDILKVSLASTGFYLKKFLYPFPLNFYIFSINIWGYMLFFILSFTLFLIYGYHINNKSKTTSLDIIKTYKDKSKSFKQYSFFLLWAFLGICPAILVAIKSASWTNWAERYLYFSNIPLSIITGLIFVRCINKSYNKTFFSILAIFVIAIFSFSTYKRSVLWNDNLSFWSDTYKINPEKVNVSLQYGVSLLNENRDDEAKNILSKALNYSGPKHLIYLNLGYIEKKRKRYNSAINYFNKALVEADSDMTLILMKNSLKTKIYKSLANVQVKLAEENRDKISKKLKFYYDAIYSLNKVHSLNQSEILVLYRIANIYLLLNEETEAKSAMKRFISGNPPEHYLKSARKFIKNIAGQIN